MKFILKGQKKAIIAQKTLQMGPKPNPKKSPYNDECTTYQYEGGIYVLGGPSFTEIYVDPM